MAAPPEKKESNSILMILEKWKKDQFEQISPVHHIIGYPWRARIYKGDNNRHNFSLICDKSNEAELWEFPAIITQPLRPDFKPIRHTFTSWDKESQERYIDSYVLSIGAAIRTDFIPSNYAPRWRLRPTLDAFDVRDRTLVIGAEKKKIQVNKESLASQSSFFDKLFNGNFKEKNMVEIPIGDVEYEEFLNIIKMVYGFDGTSLTDGNVRRVLQLSDRFDLKIVEDKVVNYLLSSSSSISIHKKLLIAEQYNIPFLKERIFSQYDKNSMMELSKSPEFEQLSFSTVREVLEKCARM